MAGDLDPGSCAMIEFDRGPSKALARHLADAPGYTAAQRELFWYDWGPVFYRGRVSGTARLLGLASDPGPTERVACRTLVGDAGQRVQGFLSKLGLTRSYVLVNAHPLALHPGKANRAKPLLAKPAHRAWRNQFYDAIAGPKLQAVVAFGDQAQEALRLWSPPTGVEPFEVPHPSSHNETVLLNEWRDAITGLRGIVTPDRDGDASVPNYGSSFEESDYAPIPPRDLPFGLPAWFGDDAWGRQDTPRHNNCVARPSGDPEHTLVWRAPEGQP
jgi:hypothetical protein